MTVAVRLPGALRSALGAPPSVAVDAATVAAAIRAVDHLYPGVAERVLDEEGRIRRFVNVFIDDEDARYLGGAAAPLRDGQAVSVLPAAAGG